MYELNRVQNTDILWFIILISHKSSYMCMYYKLYIQNIGNKYFIAAHMLLLVTVRTINYRILLFNLFCRIVLSSGNHK